ncbi:MAG: nuclear transport factor 2 family protein [Alphaproteobacteria bacterium]|nr:nuclear transport factor 2 family protein [Alphaproteobacteria bacterium]
MTQEERNRETHRRFAVAWSEKDIDLLLRCVADDIVYGASVGPEPGTTYRGKAAAAEGFKTIMAHDRGQTMSVLSAAFHGDRAYVEWATKSSNGETRGFDVLVFRDGLITVKDAYRKCRA